jgi:hypothetical protein
VRVLVPVLKLVEWIDRVAPRFIQKGSAEVFPRPLLQNPVTQFDVLVVPVSKAV